MENTGSRTRLIVLGGGIGLAALVLLVAVFLPPFRLLQRVQGPNYTALTVGKPVIYNQEGIQIVAAPGDLDGGFAVRFDVVPQLNFLEGSAGEDLLRAAQSLPSHLTVKSSYYKISAKGKAPDSTTIAVDIPANAEPWETLDLYTWTGESWQWIGGRVDTDRQLIVAEVGHSMPRSLVVAQAGAIAPAVSAALPMDQSPAAAANSGITHLLAEGLLLSDLGGIAGDLSRLPVPTADDVFALLPSLRNWSAETQTEGIQTGTVNQAVLADMLGSLETRQAHIDNIVALVVGQGYAGIDLDYRGVSVDWRDTYSAFVADLASVLHAQGKVLSVAVEAPSPTADGSWDTGGYDWRAMGQVADIVRVPFSVGFSADGSDSEAYLTWALSQISRYKLFPNLSTYSSDQVGGQSNFINQAQALAPLSALTGLDSQVISPGETVQVKLGGEALNSLQLDQDSQTYVYTYRDDQDSEHQVTVVTPASLARPLDLAMRYHLGGVFVAGLLDSECDPAVADVVRQFASQAAPTAASGLRVIWTVQAASGGQLTRDEQPLDANVSFSWTAPDTPGEYRINAAIASQTGGKTTGNGSVAISVAALQPTETPTATPTPTPTPGAGAAGTPSPAACLSSAYVSDVTVPDNTRFEKGKAFVKTWRVRNGGSCPWPDDTKLALIDGDALSAAESVDVGALDVGGTKDISVDMAAPETDGSFQGVWRLADGAGTPFGTRLTVVIQVGEQQTVSPPPGAPPPSGGGSFELGGHINTWNYVTQMKYAGMTWAKVQVHFGQDASGLVQTAHNAGFKIQLSALGSPGMVVQSNFHADYTAWVANLARAGADAIEVWNEPNIDREWQIGQISPAAYTQLLCASYSAIKAANPNAKVISAAPAPTGYFGGCSGNGCDDLPFLQGMYNAGAANCMDYIGAHHNSGATSPSARSGHPADDGRQHHSWYFLPQTELYYGIFGGSRKLFYTEMGYASQEGLAQFSDQFAWARGTNNAQQAAWLAEAVNLSRSTGMVRCIIVWNIDFSRYGYDPQDGYAIIRPGGSCPACDTLHAALQ